MERQEEQAKSRTRSQLAIVAGISFFMFLATGAFSESIAAVKGESTDKWFYTTIACWIGSSAVAFLMSRNLHKPQAMILLILIGGMIWFVAIGLKAH